MPIATPEKYQQMIRAARDGGYAYPAINVTGSETFMGRCGVLPKRNRMELSRSPPAVPNSFRAR